MPQINAGEWRKGTKIILEGDPYDMIECNFVKPGKGSALYKLRLRNLLKGSILDRTFRSGDSLEAADIRKSDGQFLYKDSTGYVFMDNDSYEQYTVPVGQCEEKARFLLDGMVCELLYWNDQIIDMDPPSHVVMEITYTEPAVRGNTATNVTKAAVVSSGATIQVPAFVAQGEKVKVDTRTGEYVERVRD